MMGAMVGMFIMAFMAVGFICGMAIGNVWRAKWDQQMLMNRDVLFRKQQAIVDGLFKIREKLMRENRLLTWQLHGGIDGDEDLEALNRGQDYGDSGLATSLPDSWTPDRSRRFIAQVESFLRDTEDD